MIKHAFLLVITAVFCNAAFCQTDDKGLVLGVERSVADAIGKHNIGTLGAAFADDAIIIAANGSLINKQQLFQSVQNIYSVTVSEMQVTFKCNGIAIVNGTETETGKDNVGTYANKARFVDVLEKKNGQWQIISSQATAIQ